MGGGRHRTFGFPCPLPQGARSQKGHRIQVRHLSKKTDNPVSESTQHNEIHGCADCLSCSWSPVPSLVTEAVSAQRVLHGSVTDGSGSATIIPMQLWLETPRFRSDNWEVSPIGIADVGVNMDVESHTVGSFQAQSLCFLFVCTLF